MPGRILPSWYIEDAEACPGEPSIFSWARASYIGQGTGREEAERGVGLTPVFYAPGRSALLALCAYSGRTEDETRTCESTYVEEPHDALLLTSLTFT